MNLHIKPIINGLFYATITQDQFAATAVGHTKDEAAKRALGWLKREIEFACNHQITITEDDDLDYVQDTFDADEQALYRGDFLNNGIWKGLEEEVQKLAIQVARLALKATVFYAAIAFIGSLTSSLSC